MSDGWDNYEPSPIEFMHAMLLEEFHKWRRLQTANIMAQIDIDGMSFNQIVVKAKTATYEKYKSLHLDKAILKTELK